MTDTLWVRRSTRVTASSATAGSGLNAADRSVVWALHETQRAGLRSFTTGSLRGIPAMWLVSHLVFGIFGDDRRSGSAPWQQRGTIKGTFSMPSLFIYLFIFFTVFHWDWSFFQHKTRKASWLQIILVEVLSYGAGMARAQRGAVQGNNVFCLLPS